MQITWGNFFFVFKGLGSIRPIFGLKISENLKLLIVLVFYSQYEDTTPLYKKTCLKGKEHNNINGFCLKVFEKLDILMQTAWKSDSYFLRYCDFIFSKWLPMEAAVLK